MVGSNRLRRLVPTVAVLAAVATVAAGCGSSSSGDGEADGPMTLRVAMGSSSADIDGVFSVVKKAYEAKYPGRTVELTIQENDTYETGIGLQTLLSSRTPPDVYFERPGARLATRIDEGNAADITDGLNGPLFQGRFDQGAFNGMVFDGKTYMVPWSGDVTNVFWYNKKIFADNNLTPPTTWDEFIALCGTLKAAGIQPLVEGDKDKWPVGSIASHLAARVAGDEVYASTLKGDGAMNSPEFVTAFGYLQQLAEGGYINATVNAMGDEAANSAFLLGKAAMIGIGSWLVSQQLSEAPNLQMGFFNLPSMDGAGTPDSVLGVSTGFIVNEKSQHKDAALEFLSMVSSPETSKLFADAGLIPLTVEPFAGTKVDANTAAMAKLLSTAPAIITPGDNIDVKRADEFYGAAAAVIGGLKSAQEALDAAQSRVASLPKD